MTKRSKKAALLAIKYMPILGAVIMMVHTGGLLMGVDLNLADNIATMQAIPAITMLLVSHAFGFCWIHKNFTVYDLCVSLCIDWQREVGFGALLMPARTLIFGIGIILFTLLYIHRRAYNRCRCYDKELVDRLVEEGSR